MQETTHLNDLIFHLDEEGKNVIAHFSPAGDASNITFSDFRLAVHAAGFGEYKLDVPALQDAAAKYTASEAFELVIGKAVDGEFDIRIDADHINAYLTCFPACGGVPITLTQILEDAKSKNIAVPLDLEAVDHALKEGSDNILIASGKAAIHGAEGKFENLILDAKERCPHLNKYGLVDFRELGEVLVVHKGDPLMRRILATNGEAGLTLSGQTIPAKPGENVAFSTRLKGAEFDLADNNLLLAAIDGCPILQKNGVSVEPIYSVKNVDLHTGNIDFMGTVKVTGEIHTGMTVKASGDIFVSETVEGVTLIADGDINVKGGIIGRTERGSAESHPTTITCKGTCNANFVQNAHISAGDSIFIRDFSMHSELNAGHQIVVGDGNSRKGYLIGGTARATMRVKAKTIGSPARLKTIVVAGADQSLQELLVAISKAREKALSKLLNVIKLLEMASAQPGRLPKETVEAAEKTRNNINAEMAEITQDEIAIKKEIAACKEAQIVAEKKFLEGVEIHFCMRHTTMVTDKEGGVFQLKEGELAFN